MSRQSRSLLVDAIIVVVAASARVLIERVQGLVHAGSDLVKFFIPNFAWWWARPRWLGGWNQWLFGGFPANGDPQFGQLHPLGLLYAVCSPLTAAALEGALGPALAGVGMLLYLRQAGCGRSGSLVGSLSFGLGGFVAAHAMHPVVVRAALAIPWALLAIESLDGAALAAGLGAATGALLLAGHPQVMLYALALVIAYAIWLGRPLSGGRWLALSAGFGLGAAIAAGALLPASELIPLSTRAFGIVDPRDHWSLKLHHLGALIVPFANGGSTGVFYGDLRTPLWGIVETTGYPGMLVWLVALAGLPILGRDPHGRFWLVIALLALVMAGGTASTLLAVRGVRASGRLLLWWSFAAAALAALALGRSRRDATPSSSRDRAHPAGQPTLRSYALAALILAATIAAIALTGAIARRAALASALVLAAAGLAVLAARWRPGPLGQGSIVLAIAADLILFDAALPVGITRQEYESVGQELAWIREAMATSGAPAPEDDSPRSLALPLVHGADWAPLHGTRILQGYSPLVPATFALLLGQGSGIGNQLGWVVDATLARPSSHVLDLLRCRWVTPGSGRIRGPLGDAISVLARQGSARWEELAVPGTTGFRYYVNHRARPVAWLVDRVRVVSADQALRLVRGLEPGDDFDPSEVALVESPVPGIAVDDAPQGEARPARQGQVRVQSYLDDEIRLSTELQEDALLVTSELAYPGWQATVDGRPANVERVNAGFRAVVVPAGRHEIVFAYRPRLGRVGLATSGASLLALFCCAAAASPWYASPSGSRAGVK